MDEDTSLLLTEQALGWAVEAQAIGGDLLLAPRMARALRAWDREGGRAAALAWLAILVGVPDRETWRQAWALLVPLTLPEMLATRRAWLRLGPAGAFAWAAGLPLAEAEERYAAGGLEEDGLAVLAGLRGWVFPAVAA